MAWNQNGLFSGCDDHWLNVVVYPSLSTTCATSHHPFGFFILRWIYDLINIMLLFYLIFYIFIMVNYTHTLRQVDN